MIRRPLPRPASPQRPASSSGGGAVATLIEVTEAMKDEAAQQLGQMMTRQQEARQKLDTLTGYRREYEQRLSQQTREGTDARAIMNYRQFLSRLESAIEQAGQELAQWDQRVLQQQETLREIQVRLRSYGVIEDRRRSREQLAEDRRQQKQIDEFAARAHRSGLVS